MKLRRRLARLRIAPVFPEAEPLCRELLDFRAKPVVAQGQDVAWRERPNDDLVLAMALAAWQGERAIDWAPYGLFVV